jgi:hypothetical protein
MVEVCTPRNLHSYVVYAHLAFLARRSRAFRQLVLVRFKVTRIFVLAMA